MLYNQDVHRQAKHKNVNQEKAVVIKKRITIHEVTNMLGNSFGSVQSILMDNGKM
jgi:hypothetical protein